MDITNITFNSRGSVERINPFDIEYTEVPAISLIDLPNVEAKIAIAFYKDGWKTIYLTSDQAATFHCNLNYALYGGSYAR